MKKKSLLIVCLLAMTAIFSYAQDKKLPPGPAVTLGKIQNPHTTVAMVLANTKLVTIDPACAITSFQISFMFKDGIKDNYLGPYTVHGSEIPAEKLAMIKEHKAPMKVFIEGIKIKRGDIDLAANPIMLNCKE